MLIYLYANYTLNALSPAIRPYAALEQALHDLSFRLVNAVVDPCSHKKTREKKDKSRRVRVL